MSSRRNAGDREAQVKAAFALLGLPADADAADVRQARRTKAAAAHPDVGGDLDHMQRINAAADTALAAIEGAAALGTAAAGTNPGRAPGATSQGARGGAESSPFDVDDDGRRDDVPSFTIEVLPVEAFEALLLAAAELGEVADDDPPYHLVVKCDDPQPCWVVLDVLPDAGASTIGLHVAALDGSPLPSVDAVRNRWIDTLNSLDW